MKIEQTYIFKDGKPAYFVSTINRKSSISDDDIFAETMAYKLNNKYDQLHIVDQCEDVSGSTEGHEIVVKRLRKRVQNE